MRQQAIRAAAEAGEAAAGAHAQLVNLQKIITNRWGAMDLITKTTEQLVKDAVGSGRLYSNG